MSKSKGKGKKPAEQKSQEEKKQVEQERREEKTNTEDQGGGKGVALQMPAEIPEKPSKSIKRLRKKELRNRVQELESKLKAQEEEITRLKQESESKQESGRKYLMDGIRDLLSEFLLPYKASGEELEKIKAENKFLRQDYQALKQKESEWQTERRSLSNEVKLYKEESGKYGENINKIISAMSEFLTIWNKTCAELKVDATMRTSCDTAEEVYRIFSYEALDALDRLKASCNAQKSLQEKIESLSMEMENIAASPSQSDSEDYMVWWQGVANDCYRFLGTMREEMGYNIMVPDSALREKGYGDIKANLDKFLDTILKEASKRRG